MQALVDSPTAESIIELGDMYRKGDYPIFSPDRDMALELYHVASFQTHAAKLKFLEASLDEIPDADRSGVAFPKTYGLEKIQRAKNRVLEVAVVPPPYVVAVETPAVVVTSDSQNVHDHSLTAHVKKALEDAPSRQTSARADVVDYILNHADATPEEKANAYEVLESLGTDTHSTLHVSERDALDSMWAKIESLPTHATEAKDLLVKQLASGVEHGSVVCSTGKIARIMGALDGLPEHEPVNKPMWALREELATMAARVRDTAGDAEDFKRQATQLYVKDLGMKEELVAHMIDDYSSGF